jgi:hypothetical protein
MPTIFSDYITQFNLIKSFLYKWTEPTNSWSIILLHKKQDSFSLLQCWAHGGDKDEGVLAHSPWRTSLWGASSISSMAVAASGLGGESAARRKAAVLRWGVAARRLRRCDGVGGLDTTTL